MGWRLRVRRWERSEEAGTRRGGRVSLTFTTVPNRSLQSDITSYDLIVSFIMYTPPESVMRRRVELATLRRQVRLAPHLQLSQPPYPRSPSNTRHVSPLANSSSPDLTHLHFLPPASTANSADLQFNSQPKDHHPCRLRGDGASMPAPFSERAYG